MRKNKYAEQLLKHLQNIGIVAIDPEANNKKNLLPYTKEKPRKKFTAEWLCDTAQGVKDLGLDMPLEDVVTIVRNAWAWGKTHPNKEESFTRVNKKHIAKGEFDMTVHMHI